MSLVTAVLFLCLAVFHTIAQADVSWFVIATADLALAGWSFAHWLEHR
jgi:hypothetical protein